MFHSEGEPKREGLPRGSLFRLIPLTEFSYSSESRVSSRNQSHITCVACSEPVLLSDENACTFMSAFNGASFFVTLNTSALALPCDNLSDLVNKTKTGRR